MPCVASDKDKQARNCNLFMEVSCGGPVEVEGSLSHHHLSDLTLTTCCSSDSDHLSDKLAAVKATDRPFMAIAWRHPYHERMDPPVDY